MSGVRTGVSDSRTWQVLVDQPVHAFPRPARFASLTATLKLASPELRDSLFELFETLEVVGHTVVALPASYDARQPAACSTRGIVSSSTKFNLDRCDRTTHSRGRCDPLEREPLCPTSLPAEMREAQKVKRLALATALAFTPGRAAAAKLNQAAHRATPGRLVRPTHAQSRSRSRPHSEPPRIGLSHNVFAIG